MSKTIEFGAFVAADESRLSEAQGVARSLGVTLNSDGSRFAGRGRDGDPIKVVVQVPSGVQVTREHIVQGRNRLDALLDDDERLTDYALVKENGVLTGAVSLLTGAAIEVPAEHRAPAAPAAPAEPARWSPF